MSLERDLKRLERQIANAVKDIQRPQFLLPNVDKTRREMQERIRGGISVKNQKGRPSTFKNLKPSTIKKRRRLSREGRLSRFTSPSTSNVHETGQMIGGINARMTGSGKASILMRDRRRGEKITNQQVARFVQEERPFMNLSNREVQELKNRIAKDIEKQLTARLRRL